MKLWLKWRKFCRLKLWTEFVSGTFTRATLWSNVRDWMGRSSKKVHYLNIYDVICVRLESLFTSEIERFKMVIWSLIGSLHYQNCLHLSEIHLHCSLILSRFPQLCPESTHSLPFHQYLNMIREYPKLLLRPLCAKWKSSCNANEMTVHEGSVTDNYVKLLITKK